MTTKKDAVNKGLAAVLGGPVGQQETVTPADPKKLARAPRKPAGSAKGSGKSTTIKSSKRESVKPKILVETRKKPGAAPEGKIKVTYYIEQDTVRQLKHLAVDLARKDSALVEEAMQDLVRKYAKKKL